MSDRLDAKEIALYRYVLDNGGVIQPVPSPTAAAGYVYPLVLEYLNYGPDQDLDYLTYRQRQNLLRGTFFDRINLCPGCSHASVNFREVCAQCSSAQIGFETVIHHFRCAFVGREEAFRKGVGLICPKCSHALRSVGKDFERPTDLHFCVDCEALFSEPDVQGLCLNCRKRFSQDERLTRDVLEFQVTAAIVPALEGQTWDMTYPKSVADELPNVVSEEFLITMLDWEIKRSERYGRPLSVVAVSADILRMVLPARRSVENTAQLYAFVDRLQRIRRNTDMIGRLQSGDLLFMLTETPIERTGAMVARVRAELSSVVKGELRAGAAGLDPERPEAPEQLIGRALGNLSA